jgi:hypothetical protein
VREPTLRLLEADLVRWADAELIHAISGAIEAASGRGDDPLDPAAQASRS